MGLWASPPWPLLSDSLQVHRALGRSGSGWVERCLSLVQSQTSRQGWHGDDRVRKTD